jgi:hypothetical protein
MTAAQRRGIVRAMLTSARKDLIKIADAAPEDWNGHEMREALQIVAERFKSSAMQEDKKRARAVDNFIYERNL